MSAAANVAMKVVSLVPSSTETLLALGADVIACSKFCEQPHLRHVGGTKNPDIEAIVQLAPDLVVLDREENRVEDHDALVAAGLNVFVSDVTDVSGAIGVVHDLAARVEASVPEAIGRAFERDVPVELDVSVEPDVPAARRTAFVPIWRRPWMTISAATYGADLLAHLAIDVVSGTDTSAYPTVELEAIASLHPDLVVVPSEPYEFEARHLAELADALPDAQIVEVDGQDLFWWGIRTPAALTRLSTALAPRPTP